MIDYIVTVVVGVLGALAVGYAYRAARAAEEVLKKLEAWEAAWRQYYTQAPVEEAVEESPKVREVRKSSVSQKVENPPAVEEKREAVEEKPAAFQRVEAKSMAQEVQKVENPAGGDYVAELLKKITCAGELMKSMGGCAPIEEVKAKCGLGKIALRELFKLRESTGEVCLKTVRV